jgi:soluble lytic murein transglycosylase
LAQAEDLYTPHINIPIGSAYLRELWDKYNGELIPAVASYNASEKAIMNWLKNRYHGDSLNFIEDIPYEETRLYVKLVLRNLITYQMIISTEDKYYFPDWILRIGR